MGAMLVWLPWGCIEDGLVAGMACAACDSRNFVMVALFIQVLEELGKRLGLSW